MKLLLDENLPHQMRLELPGHEVFTVAYMNWAGIENGELLRLASAEGFDVVITNDRGLEYEQDVDALPIAVVVLVASANTIESVRLLYPKLLAALPHLRTPAFLKLSDS